MMSHSIDIFSSISIFALGVVLLEIDCFFIFFLDDLKREILLNLETHCKLSI